jgi:hypothetical protein
MEFVPFPKIPRLKRKITVTEKIDGTNASIYIRHAVVEGLVTPLELGIDTPVTFPDGNVGYLRAGSRRRWLPNSATTKDDNFGFGAWVYQNAHELAKLGEGHHFGEWWGAGIQRRYGLAEKRFSLFNVRRWGAHNPPPACCSVVPVLAQGPWGVEESALGALRHFGSVAAPGFMDPEGVVVWHGASKSYFKVTLDKDEQPKGAA